MADEGVAQVLRHLGDQHVVLREVAARRVEDRGVVGNRLRDDPVSRLGHDGFGRANEILVADAGVVHRLFIHADKRTLPFRGRHLLARAAERKVRRRHDRVLLELRQRVGLESGQTVAAERREDNRLVGRQLQRLAHLLARLRGVPRDERDVLDVRKGLESATHGQAQRHRRLRIRRPDGRQQ